MNQVPFDQLTHDRFSSLLKTHFRIREEGTVGINLELTEVKKFQLGTQPSLRGASRQSECFSLIFKGPLSRYLEQKIYDLEHDQLGPFALFLVPVGKTEDAFQYEAIFNRLS